MLRDVKFDFLLNFDWLMMTLSSSITEGEEVRVAARRFKEKTDVVYACRTAATWEMPPRLKATKVMPRYILHFLCKLYESYGLYERCRSLPEDMWSLVLRSWLYSTDPKVLLATDCCRVMVSARKSKLERARASKRFLCKSKLWETGVAGSYYGSLAYADPERELRSRKQYGRGYTAVTEETIRKPVAELEIMASDSRG